MLCQIFSRSQHSKNYLFSRLELNTNLRFVWHSLPPAPAYRAVLPYLCFHDSRPRPEPRSLHYRKWIGAKRGEFQPKTASGTTLQINCNCLCYQQITSGRLRCQRSLIKSSIFGQIIRLPIKITRTRSLCKCNKRANMTDPNI